MVMRKIIVKKLNEIAQEDFEKAKTMLEGINLVSERKYGWLNKRVVFYDKGRMYDAYVNTVLRGERL